ncbi:MAG TPA: DUF4340 domain-containing protein [Isosphaeraceae bacterium]|jgi:hypothetical protein|nr:DUF4340 domain-containing protein [Isosphaeraceae bacterium]
MKHRSTVVLIIVFFTGLICLWWADYANIPTEAERKQRVGRVLPDLLKVKPAEVLRLEITGDASEPKLIAFERRDGGRWQIVKPIDTMASQSRVENLVRQLLEMRPARGTENAAIKAPLWQYGLDHPAHVVRVYGTDASRPLAELEVGKVENRQRFVRAAGSEEVRVVDALALGMLDQPLVDWRERALFSLATFQVQKVSVHGSGHDLEAMRSTNHWRLLRPIKAMAESEAIEGVIADLASLQVADAAKGYVAEDVKDFASYGLDKPQMTIELVPRRTASTPSSESLARQVVEIGKPVPGKAERAYARRADQRTVVIVDTRSLKDLGKNPQALRNKRLVDFDLARVDYIDVEAKDVHYVLARGREGWEVLSPSPGRGDIQTVQNFLKHLNDAQSSDFLDPAKNSTAGMDKPSYRIRVWQAPADAPSSLNSQARPEGEPVLDLTLGAYNRLAKAFYGQTEGDPTTLLTLPENLVEVLPSGPLAFNDRSLLAQRPDDITKFSVDRDGTTFAVESGVVPSEYSKWRMTKPAAGSADAEVVARLVVLLARVRAETLVTEKPESYSDYGLDSPALTVNWTVRPPALPRGVKAPSVATTFTEWTLHVGKEVPGKRGSRYARLSGNPAVFTISPLAFQYLSSELRDRRVFKFKPEQATRVEIQWPGLTVAYARTPATGGAIPGWTAEPGTDPSVVNTERITSLVTVLSALNAARFTQYEGPFPAQTGLTPPQATIEILLSGEEKPRQLHIGNAGPEGMRSATTAPGSEGPVILLVDTYWASWATPPAGHGELPENVFAP